MKPIILASFTLATVQIAGCGNQQTEENKRPNILFAISDDQSFGHTSFSGSNFVKTPALDRVAGEGSFPVEES